MVDVRLVPVSADNWRDCVALRVVVAQQRWVADVSYYLCLCTYGDTWHPLAVEVDGRVVGFLMWGVDDDASRWIGGLVVDAGAQRRGIGAAAVLAAVRVLVAQEGCTGIGLSFAPDNAVARGLYARLGFVETGETEGDGEVVARMSLDAARALAAG